MNAMWVKIKGNHMHIMEELQKSKLILHICFAHSEGKYEKLKCIDLKVMQVGRREIMCIQHGGSEEILVSAFQSFMHWYI